MANIGLNRKQISFIDKIVREIRFSGGRKPSRSSIVMIFTKIAMCMKFDVSGIKSEKETEERFLQALRNTHKNAGKKCKGTFYRI